MSDPQILKRQLILQHIMSNEVYDQFLNVLYVLLIDNMAPVIYLSLLEEDKQSKNKKFRVLLQDKYHKRRTQKVLETLQTVLHTAGMDVFPKDTNKLLTAAKDTLEKDVKHILTQQGLSLDVIEQYLQRNENKRITWDLLLAKFFPKHKSKSQSRSKSVSKSKSKSRSKKRRSLKKKECPPGKYRSRTTRRCKKDRRKPCKSGWVRNPSTNRCRKQK